MAKSFTKTVQFKNKNVTENIKIDVDWYNNAYGKHERKADSEYTKEPEKTWYYEAWLKVLEWVGLNDVLDLGCGPGQFAKMCIEKGLKYSGIDYSKVAIRMAAKMTGKPELFRVADITKFKQINPKGGTIVMLEVLEHIVEDLSVIGKITTGSDIIFSVPNYNYRSHVRFFPGKRDIKKRYSKLVFIDEIHTVPLNEAGTKVIYLVHATKK